MTIDLVTPFFSHNPFVEDGIFTAPLTDPKTIQLIFDRSESIFAAGIKIQNSDTMATVKTSDVGDPVPAGSTVTIRSIVYKIIKPFSDGTGITTLQLSKN
jgi:hypothetical protein